MQTVRKCCRALGPVLLLMTLVGTTQAAGPIPGAQLNLPGMEKCAYKSITGTDPQGASVTDAGLTHLRGMRQLQELSLNGSQVTDAGLENLNGLTELQMLRLKNVKVTSAGIEKLCKALPGCYIDR